MSITRTLIALGLTLATARAEVVVIDPAGAPGWPMLMRALDVASAGDVLLLEPGDYKQPAFVYLIDKGITLLPASTGARITLGPIQIQDLPAGQTVVLRGFDVQTFPDATSAMAIFNTRGTAWIEDCQFTGSLGGTSFPSPGGFAATVNRAHAIFRHCSFEGGAGGDATSGTQATVGGDALHVASLSQVALYDCTLVGGEHGSGLPSDPASSSALAAGFADITVSGCTLTGGEEGADNDAQPGTSGSAIVAKDIIVTVRVLQSELLPGAVQGSGTQGPAIDATPSAVEMLAEPARSLVLPAFAQVGQVATLLLDGERGDLALIMMSPAAGAMPAPSLEGTLALQPGSFGSPVVAGVLPGPDGQLSLSLSSGLLPPGVEGMTMFAQGVFVDADGRSLGGASAITWLDMLP